MTCKMFMIGLTLCAASAHAGELYKWVDDMGRVHYSDQKPQTTAETVDIAPTLSFLSAPQLAPIPKRTGQITIGLWVVQAAVNIDPNTKIGVYSFGTDCVSPTAMTWPAAQKMHPELFLDTKQQERSIVPTIIELGYVARNSFPQALPSNLNIMKGYALWPTIVDMEYHLCAVRPDRIWPGRKNKRMNMGFEPSQFQYNDFSRQRVTVTIHWKLTDELSGKSLFETTTRGSMDHWEQDIFGHKTLDAAIANATKNLWAQSEFVDQLNASTLPTPPKPTMRFAQREKDRSISGLLSGLLVTSAQKQAHFTQVLMLLNPIKMRVIEYFYSQEKWPEHFGDLDLESNQLQEPDYIDHLVLQPDGTIIAYLAPATFGNNGVLLLTPRMTMNDTSIAWDCSSNLESEYWGNSDMCSALPQQVQ